MGICRKEDIISVAKSMLDVQEGTVKHREIIDYYNSKKPQARGYRVKYNDPWCATFVSWCFLKMGATNLLGGTECGCEEFIKIFKKKCIWYEDENTFNVQTGDIILYSWNCAKHNNDKYASHIGIVEEVDHNGNLVVIEGNYSDRVKRRYIHYTSKDIRGYARPQYDTEEDLESTVAEHTPKWVGKCTANRLNVRTGNGVKYPIFKYYPILEYGNLVDVCDSLRDDRGKTWYYIRIAGRYFAWVSSAYIVRA